MATGLHQFANYLIFVLRRFWDDRLSQVAASLTFTTLLSLVPLLAIGISMASAIPLFGDLTGKVQNFIASNLLPGTAASTVILDYMEQFSQQATQLTAVGIITLGVTSMLLLDTIGDAFDLIWRYDSRARHRSMARTLLLYIAILVVGPVVFGISVSATSYLVGVSMGYTSGIPLLGQFLLKFSTELITVAGFALLYFFMPNARVNPRHALVGGATAGVLFEIMGRLFAFYITQFPSYTVVYGAFSAIPIFLIWIYFSWIVVLFGALIAASLQEYRT